MKSLSHVRLFATPWTVAYQASQTMGFSGQEYWRGFSFPSPGDVPDPVIEPGSPALEADALPSEPPRNLNMPVERIIQYSNTPAEGHLELKFNTTALEEKEALYFLPFNCQYYITMTKITFFLNVLNIVYSWGLTFWNINQLACGTYQLLISKIIGTWIWSVRSLFFFFFFSV